MERGLLEEAKRLIRRCQSTAGPSVVSSAGIDYWRVMNPSLATGDRLQAFASLQETVRHAVAR